ncbi:MAG: ATP-binding protein [Bacteroidetes bacterium]|nr:ATP-binding protein [Bacteroidota bacterium]
MLKRTADIELTYLLRHFPVVAILGPRQVGKTTLAKSLVKKLQKPAIYLDLELNSDLRKLEDPQLFLDQYTDNCVIIDEVQRLPGLFPLFRALVDRKRVSARFLLLGSASPDLMKNSSETLAGRIAYIELSPFNILEIKNKKNASQHWLRGGFPNALLATNSNLWLRWMNNFVTTYIERDLPMLGMPAAPALVHRLWSMLAHHHGGELNYSQFGKALELTSPTVKGYIDFLEYAFLIRRLPPFSTNSKKRLVKSPKVYIRDSGLLHYLNGISTQDGLINNLVVGNSWEGYVIEQVQQLLDERIKLYFYRTSDGSEIDLVFARGNIPVATAEIKFTAEPYLSKGNFISIDDLNTKKNFIIIPGNEDYLYKQNVRVCGLNLFLQKYLKSIK